MQLEAVGMGLPGPFHRSQGGVLPMPFGNGLGTRRHPARNLVGLTEPVMGWTCPSPGCRPTGRGGRLTNISKRSPPPKASAQLSYQFCVATAITHGKVTKEAFGAPARSDRQTNAYCELVKVSVDEGCQATYPSLRSARVTVVLKDGRSFERFIDEPSGSVKHPLPDKSVVSKFVELASPILGEEPSRAAAETLLGAHLATRAGDLVSCLLPSAAHG